VSSGGFLTFARGFPFGLVACVVCIIIFSRETIVKKLLVISLFVSFGAFGMEGEAPKKKGLADLVESTNRLESGTGKLKELSED